MTKIQLFTLAYAALFAGVVLLDFIPMLKDANGFLFGLFALDLYDNSLHAFSGVWAFVAALISAQQSRFYLKFFGTIYFLDGVLGLFFGNAFLDFGIFVYGIADYGIWYNIFANLPHILIGGVASFVGFRMFNSED